MKKLILLGVFLLLVTGCAAMPVVQDLPPLPVFAPPAPVQWRTATVQRTDVILYSTIRPVFAAETRETLHFPQGGLEIEGIFISEWDEVVEGQIIASLKNPELEETLEELRILQERFALELQQLNDRHHHSLRMAELTETPIDDTGYNIQREVLQERLHLLSLEHAYFSAEFEDLIVRAPINGIARNVMSMVEGQRSNTAGVVAIIMDMNDAFFRIRHQQAAHVEPGQIFEMALDNFDFTFEVRAVIPESVTSLNPAWVWFEPVEDYTALFDTNTVGSITFIFEEAFDVIAVSHHAIHRAGDQYFVFVLEDGVRSVRYVELGLRTPFLIEVTKGLDAGELVVI
ncbi:MAG: efflux RND transporter periplasmic adaptor subunit [Defluviitaleaceae bacterium]|nr:efflux RND transporter periplasmic adaptor subunit [Defluviitaleaceae bacterium]